MDTGNRSSHLLSIRKKNTVILDNLIKVNNYICFNPNKNLFSMYKYSVTLVIIYLMIQPTYTSYWKFTPNILVAPEFF